VPDRKQPVPDRVLSVVMPVYNERPTIREILRRVRDQRVVREVIVVDDASTDGTRDHLQSQIRSGAFREHGPPVRLLLQQQNAGKGTALRAGFRHARAPYTVVQDADLEYNPDEYERLLRPLEAGQADAVYGSRFAGQEHRVLSFWHTLGNRVLTLLSNAFTNLNLTDMETCYKVFRTELIQGIPLRTSRFGFEPEITAKLADLRARIYEVPISYHGRSAVEGKKIGWHDGLRAIRRILSTFLFEDLDDRLDRRLLRMMKEAGAYHRWLHEQLEPALGDRVVVMDAGCGHAARHMLDREAVVLTERDPDLVRDMRRRHGSLPTVRVHPWHPEREDPPPLDPSPDTVLFINGLQTCGNDERVIRRVHRMLAPGGTFAGIVAANPRLKGSLDDTLDYLRRYRRDELKNRLDTAGFDRITIGSFNVAGRIAWSVKNRCCNNPTLTPRQIRLFEYLLPFLQKLETGPDTDDGLHYRFVARKET